MTEVAAGETRPTGSPEPTIDADVLGDLRRCARSCAVLWRRNVPIQLWEAYSVLQTKRDLLLAEVERLSKTKEEEQGVLHPEAQSELDGIRNEVGPLSNRLKQFLDASSTRMDSVCRELVTLFILTKNEGRQTLICWLSDPEGMAEEASARIQAMGSTADAYRKAMRGPARAAPRAPEAAAKAGEDARDPVVVDPPAVPPAPPPSEAKPPDTPPAEAKPPAPPAPASDRNAVRDRLKAALSRLKAKSKAGPPMAMPSDRVEVPLSPPAESEAAPAPPKPEAEAVPAPPKPEVVSPPPVPKVEEPATPKPEPVPVSMASAPPAPPPAEAVPAPPKPEAEAVPAPPKPEAKAEPPADQPAEPASPPPTPAPAAATAAPAGPKGPISEQVLENLRLVERCRKIFEGLEIVEGWDILSIIASQREVAEKMINQIEDLKERGGPGEFEGSSVRLRQALGKMRAAHGKFVNGLRTCFEGLFGRWGGEKQELALALLVSSRKGRERATLWVKEPERRRKDATVTLNGLMVRAELYLVALAKKK